TRPREPFRRPRRSHSWYTANGTPCDSTATCSKAPPCSSVAIPWIKAAVRRGLGFGDMAVFRHCRSMAQQGARQDRRQRQADVFETGGQPRGGVAYAVAALRERGAADQAPVAAAAAGGDHRRVRRG